ncbi:RNA polymerase sigma factor [Ktedonospora formicarum]|uniref:RNA polymerase subunit sigma-24 n=1 Tax=Ktedonospora formicarum TaxID=2778364 RepID=A0A8J3HWR4_9CHLR|nr:sigma-70 family RNA polymerase sigma factor [Ktedonospora formicarum]GHO43426.1 RNA polymerase subunit sigma-24 [Ktedonospora formicarum]
MDTLPATKVIEALIHDYSALVFHTIYGLTNDWEESQDLTQDTFHQALRGIDAARAASGDHFQPKAWLLRIALNTVRMQRRRRKILSFIPFSHVQGEKQPATTQSESISEQAAPLQPSGFGAQFSEDPAETIAERDAVQRALARLPEPLRVCLLLSATAGLSTAQIGDLLALKEPAVRQRLARARKQFQQLYAYETGEDLVSKSEGSEGTTANYAAEKNEAGFIEQTRKPQQLSLNTLSTTCRSSYA